MREQTVLACPACESRALDKQLSVFAVRAESARRPESGRRGTVWQLWRPARPRRVLDELNLYPFPSTVYRVVTVDALELTVAVVGVLAGGVASLAGFGVGSLLTPLLIPDVWRPRRSCPRRAPTCNRHGAASVAPAPATSPGRS